jgi:serine/threonine protein kinase
MADGATGQTFVSGEGPPTDGSLPAGFVLSGRYRIEGPLGRGGMGAVYAARHINMGNAVAVKVLLPELAGRLLLLQRFAAEARAAAALAHPHIVKVHDFDRHDQLHFLVMEKLEGESLLARMNREGPLSVAFVARVGAEICDAMAAAHGGKPKIIHRDLKPENVFLAREGRQPDVVKVLDFGIAKLIEPEGEVVINGLTSTGQMAGTPLYMSLEQLRSAKDVDERADIYSIGVMLYHALTGHVPYSADSLAELVLAINRPPPKALQALRPDVPRGLAAVIQRAMARDREDRFDSAETLREQLLPYLAVEEEVPGLITRATRRRVVLGAAGATVVGALGTLLLRPRSPTLALEGKGAPRPRQDLLAGQTARAKATPVDAAAATVAPTEGQGHAHVPVDAGKPTPKTVTKPKRKIRPPQIDD